MKDWLYQVAPFLSHYDLSQPETLAQFWEGLVNTVQLVFVALVVGIVLSAVLAVARACRWRWLSGLVWLYTYVFRGTPLLVQLYILYYGFAFMPSIKDSALAFVINDPLYPALLAFILNTGAYTTEIFYGAIRATPRGELEAARAYGMSAWTAYRRIVLPSAFRRALPAYGNEVIFMLHASAIVSVVTITDLTGAAYQVVMQTYSPFPPFILVACIYLLLSLVLQAGFRLLERRLLGHLQST